VKTGGRARRQVLIELCPEVPGGVVVDVGADHGNVAYCLGAIATERQPRRMGRRDVRWVVADGLRPFRRVDVAIVAGMGAHTIARILERGPRPQVAAILHAQDDPPLLREWLAANGWRIEAERLAPEAGRFAEVLRVVPGVEEATGDELRFGPRLLRGDDRLLPAHLAELEAYYRRLSEETRDRAPTKYERYARWSTFLRGWRVSRGFSL
jgi:tRNA A22 N-methylase